MWYILATVFILIIAVVLILTVLVQNSKGGGLSASFGGSSSGNQFGGVAQTNKFLERATWGLAIGLLFFSLVASMSIPKQKQADQRSDIFENMQNYDFNRAPTVPVNITPPEEN